MKSNIASALLALSILIPAGVVADGGDKEWTVKKSGVREEPTPNQASDASFDKRLPPVLPGEEVSDGDKKIKVWSTAGSVSANEPPAPNHSNPKHHLHGIDGVSVIVDQRPDSINGRPRREVSETSGRAPRVEKPEAESAPADNFPEE